MKVRYIQFILYVISFITFIPMFWIGRDLWDGVIISHAMEIKNREIYWNWFTESGWFLVPFLYDVFYFLTGKSTFLFFMQLFMVTCHLIAAHHIYLLGKRIFNLSPYSALVSSGFFLFSPIWNIYFSTVFVPHAGTLALALFCVNKILDVDSEPFYKLVYVLLSLFTFQLASCAALIISLLLADWSINHNYSTSRLGKITAYTVFAMAYFFGTRWLFPTHGLYSNYNQIDPMNLVNTDTIAVFYQFIQHVYPFLIFGLFIAMFSNRKKNNQVIITYFFLLIVNILPFLLVNKPPWPSHFYGIQGWDQRQAITVLIPISLFFGYVVSVSHEFNKTVKFMVAIWLCVSTYHFGAIYYTAMLIKVKSAYLQTGMEVALSEVKKDVGDCGVEIRLDTPSAYNYLNSYVLSYATYNVFGKKIYTYSSHEGKPDTRMKKIYLDKYIIPNKVPNCVKKVIVTTNLDKVDGWGLIWKHNPYYVSVNVKD